MPNEELYFPSRSSLRLLRGFDAVDWSAVGRSPDDDLFESAAFDGADECLLEVFDGDDV